MVGRPRLVVVYTFLQMTGGILLEQLGYSCSDDLLSLAHRTHAPGCCYARGPWYPAPYRGLSL